MGRLSALFDRAFEALYDMPYAKMIFSMVVFASFLQISVFVHEFGHWFFAKLFGYESYITALNQYFGATAVPDSVLPQHLIIIAYAGPLVAFAVGSYLWFAEENGLARLGGLLFWLYSCLPNLYPLQPFTDAFNAVKAGFSASWALFIYAIVLSFISYEVLKEVRT